MFHLGNFLNRPLEFLPGLAAGITFVSKHHGCPLLCGHGPCATICQKIDAAIYGIKCEHVVMRSLKCFDSRFPRNELYGLRHLNAKRFNNGSHTMSPA